MRRFLTTAMVLLAASVASAQRLPDLPAPADVATPPAEALKSPSGLVSRIVTPGTGTATPQETDFVTVHYTGWTSEGSSSTVRTRAACRTCSRLNRVMAGWHECVFMMTVGEIRRCWVPQESRVQRTARSTCRHRRLRYRTARRPPNAERTSARCRCSAGRCRKHVVRAVLQGDQSGHRESASDGAGQRDCPLQRLDNRRGIVRQHSGERDPGHARLE